VNKASCVLDNSVVPRYADAHGMQLTVMYSLMWNSEAHWVVLGALHAASGNTRLGILSLVVTVTERQNKAINMHIGQSTAGYLTYVRALEEAVSKSLCIVRARPLQSHAACWTPLAKTKQHAAFYAYKATIRRSPSSSSSLPCNFSLR